MSCRRHILTALIAAICLYISGLAYCADSVAPPVTTSALGDRISSTSFGKSDGDAAALITESYPLGPGDVLSIRVEGRSAVNYKVGSDSAGQIPGAVVVSPSGDIFLQLVGTLKVAGKTTAEVQAAVKTGLEKYLKHFQVSVALSTARPLRISVGGEVQNTGPRELPAMSTAGSAVLGAGIQSSGTMRRIEIIRNGEKHYLDLYRLVVLGETDSDINLLSGDTIYVPAVKNYVDVGGEVVRPGRFEMVPLSGGKDAFRVEDLLTLSLGTQPTAALNRATIERIGADGQRISMNVDLSANPGAKGRETVLQPGDTLLIPSITAFQPMILMVGEFVSRNLDQRTFGESVPEIQNRSSVYYLRQGQTMLDVITATGGVTPQADLKRARIEREEAGKKTIIPVDLERLLVKRDSAADVKLMSGDTLVLPALTDKIHLFGEITKPGSYVFSPNRRLLDYVGEASGPTPRAMMTRVRVVRGTAEKPQVLHLNADRAMRGAAMEGNPVLEPGDIVFVPSKFIADWQDGVQLIFTALSLRSLLRR